MRDWRKEREIEIERGQREKVDGTSLIQNNVRKENVGLGLGHSLQSLLPTAIVFHADRCCDPHDDERNAIADQVEPGEEDSM